MVFGSGEPTVLFSAVQYFFFSRPVSGSSLSFFELLTCDGWVSGGAVVKCTTHVHGVAGSNPDRSYKFYPKKNMWLSHHWLLGFEIMARSAE